MKTEAPLKIGLMPFYLKLYDDLQPDRRAGFTQFIDRVSAAFKQNDIAVVTTPVCRVAPEFAHAVEQLEQHQVDCIVTLHLAYSPSLEAVKAFCQTSLPIVMLDTSMDAEFGLRTEPDRIMYNHGIHGVMDFASILRRHQRPFEIVAGHLSDDRLIKRAVGLIKAARGAASLSGSRLLRIGDAFQGMGDFSVDPEILTSAFGFRIDRQELDQLDQAIENVDDAEVDREITADRERYICDLPAEIHARSVRVGLGLRQLLNQGSYQGFSINFQSFNRKDRPAGTMPFLEIAKSMARGIGYAGEGDVLTAALVGALQRSFEMTTFTEIFCADWNGNSLFLSHMGEINPAVAAGQPRIIEKPLLGGQSFDPAVLTCDVKPGPAVFVNLAPGPEQTFSLLIAPVEVLEVDSRLHPGMQNIVRTWIRPPIQVAQFLEAYSRAGGTHHSALVLGSQADAIAAFGRRAGIETVRIS